MINLNAWIIENELADNTFSAKGMIEGMDLMNADVNMIELEKRCRIYRAWRPTHKTFWKSHEAFDLAIAGIEPGDYIERQIEMPCGHPLSSVVGDVTKYCSECADNARFYAPLDGLA